MNVICFGDSITQAVRFAEGDRWPVILDRLLASWRPGGFKVFNAGASGNTSAQGLERMGKDVLPLLPGVVLVEFGLNDSTVRPWTRVARVGAADLERNLREIHRIVRSKRGRCVFLANHRYFRKGTRAPESPRYNRLLRSVARSLGAPLVDVERGMIRGEVDMRRFLGDDGVHLSPEGNHVYARIVFEGLRPILEASYDRGTNR